MPSADLVPLAVAAGILGVGSEQVRRYVQRGILPADKIGSVWLTSAAHARALRFAPPRRGRPLAAEAAWESIIGGDIDIDDPWRHVNRGRLTRWAATAGAVADLVCRHDVIVSGVHAARRHGALLDPAPDEAQVYVAESVLRRADGTGDGLLAGLVRFGLGTVVVRAVPAASWDRALEASLCADAAPRLPFGSPLTRYALPAAVALDLAVSPHAREQSVAAALAASR